MFGKGLLKGMKITMVRFFKPKETVQYPEVRLPLPDRFLGKPEFYYDKCIACNQCVAACPNNVITLKTETVEKKKIVTQYDFDQQYCLFCGLCAEACPKDALKFTKDFELTQYKRQDIKLKFVQPEQVAQKRAEVLQAAWEKQAALEKQAAQEKQAVPPMQISAADDPAEEAEPEAATAGVC
jgi:NADH-quinone oxidoreductase subunit I